MRNDDSMASCPDGGFRVSCVRGLIPCSVIYTASRKPPRCCAAVGYLSKMPSSDGTANLPPVLIIGCGISGLALANALLNHKVPFLVFERDLSLRHRGQGYRFRIQSLGITAIDELCRGAESMGDFELRKRIPLAYTALRPSRKTVDALTAQDIEVTQYSQCQVKVRAELTIQTTSGPRTPR